MKTINNKQLHLNIKRLLLIPLMTLMASVAWAADKDENKAIANLMQSKKVDARKNAATILKHKDSMEAANALAQALSNDPAVQVRTAAAASLWGHTQAMHVQSALRSALDDEPEVAVRAAGALKSLGIPIKELAIAFRKGLQARGTASQFNGARGLIGIDDGITLLPYLLNHLQQQSNKNNQSGIKAAGDALAKLVKKDPSKKLLNALIKAVKYDQVGDYVLLPLIDKLNPAAELMTPVLIKTAGSSTVLNRVAASQLIINYSNDTTLVSPTIKQLFNDSSPAVQEAVAYACGQSSKHLKVCENGLRNLLNSTDKNLREASAEALSGSAYSSKTSTSTGEPGISTNLKTKALQDPSDDVRYNAIDAYISSDNSDKMKADLLVEVALKESQVYIITFALSRLNRYQQHLDDDQKQRLIGLQSHADAEVRRIANLIF